MPKEKTQLFSIMIRIPAFFNSFWGETVLLLFFAVFYWMVYYWQSPQFGLYEDDLTILPRAFSFSFMELISHIWYLISNLYGHARPLHDSFIYFFSWVGWRINDLWGAYWIGFFLSFINIAIFYYLVRRVSNKTSAFICTLVYCLFATDTTKIYLTHSLGLQPSITLLLLACHAYLSNKKALSYLLAFIILFAYETPFLVFLGIPLLKMKWDKKLIQEMLYHSLILGGMLIVVFLIRAALGEGRVVELSRIEIVKAPFEQVVKGIMANINGLYLRPSQVITQMTPLVKTVTLISAIFFVIIIFLITSTNQPGLSDPDSNPEWSNPKSRLSAVLKLFLSGLMMLAMSYPISFILNASALNGRASRVHAAAVIGASLITGSLIMGLITLIKDRRFRFAALLPLSLYLSFFVGFGFVVQNEYRLAWSYQKHFWSELVPLIQDASENEIILVGVTDLPETTQIEANTWNVPRLLDQIYMMPVDWDNPPRVYRLLPGWENTLLTPAGKVSLQLINVAAPPSLYGEFDANRIIFIDWDGINKRLVRRQEPLVLSAGNINVLPPGENILPSLPRGILYRLLFD
jgi:hypothetical protein